MTEPQVCKNCGEPIERNPFDVGDAQYKWRHIRTRHAFCEFVLIAEPADEPLP